MRVIPQSGQDGENTESGKSCQRQFAVGGVARSGDRATTMSLTPRWLMLPATGELGLLGRAIQGRRRGAAAGDALGDLVEVAGAHEALVLGRVVAALLPEELALLHG